jgi:protoheme ferro-lyase
LGISEANVKVRLNRAKAMLRKAVEQNYHPEDIFEFNLKYCNPLTEKLMKQLRSFTVVHVHLFSLCLLFTKIKPLQILKMPVLFYFFFQPFHTGHSRDYFG